MFRRFWLALMLAITSTGVLAKPAHAQADILLQLRSGSPAGDRFRVDSAGGVVAKSIIGIGLIPQTGAGDRMMWDPYKGAFRAGGVDGPQWDHQPGQFYSFAVGLNTQADGNYSFAGGFGSGAMGSYSVGIGYEANATGTASISLGYRTTANGSYSVALGQRASAAGFTGVMVMSDQSTSDSTLAIATNSFTSRYAGGYRLFTNATKTTGVSLNAGGSSWNVISDRNRKEGFAALDGETVLLKLRTVPVSVWRYKDEADRTIRHVGPMAQDWHAAFGLTSDDKIINMSDMDGISLAGVKALDTRTSALLRRLDEKDKQIEDLNARVQRLEELLRAVAVTKRDE